MPLMKLWVPMPLPGALWLREIITRGPRCNRICFKEGEEETSGKAVHLEERRKLKDDNNGANGACMLRSS